MYLALFSARNYSHKYTHSLRTRKEGNEEPQGRRKKKKKKKKL
jgi:hypothetical protein